MPKCVCVLPTSIVRSTEELSAGSEVSEAADALVEGRLQRAIEVVAIRRIQLEQRLQHEPAVPELRMRDPVLARVDGRMREHQHVDVERPRRMPRGLRVATELDLDALGRRKQSLRIQVRFDLEAGIEEVLLAHRSIHRRGLVDVRLRRYLDAVALERVATGAHVRQPIADVRPQAKPSPQSTRSFQTSTVTSSTGSGIGGSGLVARTVTASAL